VTKNVLVPRREFLRQFTAASALALLPLPRLHAAAGPAWSVKVGVCGSADNWSWIKAAGCDYVEESVGKLLNPRGSDEDFAKRVTDIRASGAVVAACNGFLPGELKLVGPKPAHDEIVDYASKAFVRAKTLGISYIVLGSGGSRKVPEGFDRAKAEEQFVAVLKRLAKAAGEQGIVVAMELLNRSETNFGNSVRETLKYEEAVGSPNFKIVADLYHMLREDEDPSAIIDAGKRIVHCHIAEKAERSAPGVKGDDFKPYLRALKKVGYTGRISLECRWKNQKDELAPAVAALRQQIAAVSAEI
jgi:sugar phosphate isomerase/epimerase